MVRRAMVGWVCAVLGACGTDNFGDAPVTGGSTAPADASLPPVVGREAGGPPPIVVQDAGGGASGGDASGGGGGGGGRAPFCAPGREEACNDLDDNCDGFVDEGCVCMGPEKSCYPGHPADLEGRGTQCRAGRQACDFETYGPCEGFVLPSAEVCDGLDNDCNGRVDDIGQCDNTPPEALCPPDQAGPPLASYDLRGGYRDADGDPMAQATWRVVEQPGGSTAQPMPANALDSQVFVDLQGTFVFELEVRDADGGVGRCQTRVQATGSDALRIEMVWNAGAQNDASDVDMHLRRPGGEWFDGGDTGSDCYFSNCRQCTAGTSEEACREELARINADPAASPTPVLTWFPPADDDDPRLDLDDVEGLGPENINIRRPRDGAYRLGVHYWDEDGFGASTVSVRVFCGGELAREFEPVVLMPDFTGGGSSSTEFWEVADIVWANGTCQVNELGVRGCRQICTRGEFDAAPECPRGQQRGEACR